MLRATVEAAKAYAKAARMSTSCSNEQHAATLAAQMKVSYQGP